MSYNAYVQSYAKEARIKKVTTYVQSYATKSPFYLHFF